VGRLLGIITMCDLLFAEKSHRLDELMVKDVFSLNPEIPLADAINLTLNRHFPLYPVCDDQVRLVGRLRGQAMFQAKALEIGA
jgi:magnesium transporter